MHGGFRIEPGSAARDAAQRNREQPAARPQALGLRLGSQAGRKFEFEAGGASHPGEAMPAEIAPAPSKPETPAPAPIQLIARSAPVGEVTPSPVQPQAAQPVAATQPEAPPQGVAKLWSKLQGFFRSK